MKESATVRNSGRSGQLEGAAPIAPIRHRIGKPPAHPKLAFRAPQQQQTAVPGLVAAAKIHCEFLAPDC
jgi:hypothetical protein